MNGDSKEDKQYYLDILLREYSECCTDVRNFDTLIWQTTTLLTAVVTFLGILYAGYLKDSQAGRIMVLLLAFLFTVVTIVAMTKHRFFAKKRIDYMTDIQGKFAELLKNTAFENKYTPVKRITEELIKEAEDTCWLNKIKAYHVHLTLAVSILIGIFILLFFELFRIAAMTV
ncbi:MAG: hypothetical protein M1167_01370 [Chloroflexi bacterium]|nr:hypothetical protein [Chloroflexota bacterium]